MKSGTTSLYRWLDSHPAVTLPRIKEPHFFSKESQWERGIDWYKGVFAEIPPGPVTGEASTSYSHPHLGSVAAARIGRCLPKARLIAVVRNPLERLRSHYRHEVLRGRENRSFTEAIQAAGNEYVGTSLYHQCFAPYLEQWNDGRLLMIRLEEIEAGGWEQVLKHLELEYLPLPSARHNISDSKQAFTPALRWMWERNLDRHFKILPGPVRTLGRSLLMRGDAQVRTHLHEVAVAPVPETVVRLVSEDTQRLCEWTGLESWSLQAEPPG